MIVIEKYTFYDCINLVDIDGLKIIDSRELYGCKSSIKCDLSDVVHLYKCTICERKIELTLIGDVANWRLGICIL